MPPLAEKPGPKARRVMAANAREVVLFLIAGGILIAGGFGVWAALDASALWLIAWIVLVILVGSLVAGNRLPPVQVAEQPLQPRAYPMEEADRSVQPRGYPMEEADQPVQRGVTVMPGPDDYKLVNIRRLLVQGFSADELHRLVRYEPSLQSIDVQFGPREDVGEMVDTIIDWGRTHFGFEYILAAAERANPRRYAVHRPYHTQDREQPASMKAYNLRRIAALLEGVFEGESLYRFCHERASLEPIWKAISREDNLSRMTYGVLACAERQVLVDDLLKEIKAAYPEAYEEHKPYEQ